MILHYIGISGKWFQIHMDSFTSGQLSELERAEGFMYICKHQPLAWIEA